MKYMEAQAPHARPGLLAQDTAEALLAHTSSLIILVEPDGRLLEWNPAFKPTRELMPQATNLQDFVAPSNRTLFRRLFRSAIKGSGTSLATLEMLNGPARIIYDCRFIPLSAGNFLFLAEAPGSKRHSEELARLSRDLQDVKRALHIKQTGLEAVLAQVDEIAHTDQLTFLSNQRKIVGDLQRRVIRCSRSKKPLTIFLLDIDRFKRINDTYGHLVGDQVLRTLAGELREGIRQSDHIGRYGGEEFLILLPGTALESAIPMAERLLNIVRSLAIKTHRQVVTLTVSIGVAQYHNGETWKDVLERADRALYQAKNNGRDEWSVSKFVEQQTPSG